MFGKSTICLSILLLVNILVVPRFCLLWLKLQIFLFKQFCKDTFLFLLNKELGVELLGQRVGICLPSEELAKLFSKVAFPLCISTHKVWVSVVPHPCHIFFQLFAFFFKFSPFNGYVVILHCGGTKFHWWVIMYYLSICMFSLDEVSAQVFFFFFTGLSVYCWSL